MTLRSFEFQTVPVLDVKWGAATTLGESLGTRFTQRNVLLVTDAGLIQAGVIDPVRAALQDAGFHITVFDQVVADPPEQTVQECTSLAIEKQVDLIIGIGGGSSLDVAKVVAILAMENQTLPEIYGIGKVVGQRLPLVLIPTTAGTGSEVTNIAIITTGEKTKMGVVSSQLYADYVLLDAALTVGLSPLQTAATGIDAMVHAIEAYTGRHKKNPLSDALAREAFKLLTANLVAACEQGNNREAREAMLLGATLAGQAFSNSPVAAVHALAYPLGGHYHIAHGLSNALMLAPVLRYNATTAHALYAELATVVGITEQGDTATRAQAFVTFMVDLIARSGSPHRLRDVQVTEESLPRLAADAMLQTRLLTNNPREIDEQTALRLYKEAF